MDHQSNTTNHKFPKRERLTNKKLIGELFEKGSSFYVHPLKVLHRKLETKGEHPQILITVPKRQFKRAVDRNLIKRRIRESFRLHKHVLRDQDYVLLIGYIYVGKEIAEYNVIETKLIESLVRLNSIT